MQRLPLIIVYFWVLGSVCNSLQLQAFALPQAGTSADSKAATASKPMTQEDPQQLFAQGEKALRAGDLALAERSFRAVLAINPQVAGVYANLGVIYMRRKQ